jgi:hypothetical protein
MTIKNKKHGTNTIAYRNGASIQRAIIPGGSVVSLVDLIDLSQVINTQDFNRGWFEVVNEVNAVATNKIEKKENSLDRAKKEVEEYAEESSSNTKDKKIKNNK